MINDSHSSRSMTREETKKNDERRPMFTDGCVMSVVVEVEVSVFLGDGEKRSPTMKTNLVKTRGEKTFSFLAAST